MTDPWERTGVVATYTGGVDVFDPDDIALPDIAAGLAHTCGSAVTAGSSTASPTTPSTSPANSRTAPLDSGRSGCCTTPPRRTSATSHAR